MPGLYDSDFYVYPDFSAGGGQMLTCRELARVGQVIVNDGQWLDANGKEFTLVDSDYIYQLQHPANREVFEVFLPAMVT